MIATLHFIRRRSLAGSSSGIAAAAAAMLLPASLAADVARYEYHPVRPRRWTTMPS